MKRDERILVLEDDDNIVFVLEEILGPYYHLQLCSDLKHFDIMIKDPEKQFDLVIADIKLKDGYFTDYLKNNYSTNIKFPCPLLITSSIDTADVLRFCLLHGACDYLVKPFNKTALLIKVEQLIKVKPQLSALTKKLKDLIELPSIQFTRIETLLLNVFYSNNDHKVGKDELIEKVWGGKISISYKTLGVHISNLRHKLKDHQLTIEMTCDKDWVIHEIK